MICTSAALGAKTRWRWPRAFEISLAHIEGRRREIAVQRRIEAKDELRAELCNELATKEDLAKLEGSIREYMAKLEGLLREEMARLEGAMNTRFERMDGKFILLFMATIFTVIFLNQEALEFLARLLGLIE